MAYGGRTYSSVSVDIVQADVDAIIDGLTGADGRTFSDMDARLATVHDLLAGNYYGPLVDMAYSAMVAADCLRGYETGPLHDGYNGAVDWLNWIESDTYELVGMVSGWYPSVLSNSYSSAVDYLDWIYSEASASTGFLAGWNSGPLTDTADRLYDWYSGQHAAELLRDMRDAQSSYLYDWYSGMTAAELLRDINYNTGDTPYLLYDGWAGRSAAELLTDIREALGQFTFDYDGRLRVTTTD